jgi:SAM-dependent methyltransferase
MHKEALDWVADSVTWWGKKAISVLEFGSLDINGSVRSVLERPGIRYLGIDIAHGKGVDIVADAAVFRDTDLFDIVVCCEVFEHTEKWPQITKNAYRNLNIGGLFVCTMAGEGRHPHSAIDENPIRDFEYYKNVAKDELQASLTDFSLFEVNVVNNDTRGRAIR